MSTDHTDAPILAPAGPVKYLAIHHERPRRKPFGTSYQIIRHPEGGALPHATSRAVLRSMRSKYVPHVGKKQLAKA